MLRALLALAILLPICAAPLGARADAQAYRKAAAARGIDTEMHYLTADDPLPDRAPSAPLPKPPAPEAEDAPQGISQNVFIAICIALLLAGAYAAARFGGARTVSFAAIPAAQRRQRPRRAPTATPLPVDLAGIAAIADRRAALEALWLAALGHAAQVHALTIGRSWTARDALRRVPAAWAHRAALARIARAAELAHFGGRDVPEDQFRALLDAAAPIFARRRGS